MQRERIRERLATLGLNQFEAAQKAGLNRFMVSDLLAEKKEAIRPAALIELAKVLDCDPEYLAGTQAEIRRGLAQQMETAQNG